VRRPPKTVSANIGTDGQRQNAELISLDTDHEIWLAKRKIPMFSLPLEFDNHVRFVRTSLNSSRERKAALENQRAALSKIYGYRKQRPFCFSGRKRKAMDTSHTSAEMSGYAVPAVRSTVPP
jgi:hypothetical protein